MASLNASAFRKKSNEGNIVIDLLDHLNLQNKYFRMYKDDLKAANDYASAGDKEALQQLCVNEVRWNAFCCFHLSNQLHRTYKFNILGGDHYGIVEQ